MRAFYPLMTIFSKTRSKYDDSQNVIALNDKVKLVLGLSMALLFPLLLVGVAIQNENLNTDIPGEYDAWLYVEYGVSSNPERYTHIELDEFNHLPYLKLMLIEGETPINHVMVEYNGVEARRAVFYLSKTRGFIDRRHLDDESRIFYIYAVEVDGRHTHIIIVFGETMPHMV